MGARLSPCEWPLLVLDDGSGGLACSELTALTEASQEYVTAMAVDLLWNWTGRKFGMCDVEVFPCRYECPSRPPTFQQMPDYQRRAIIPQVGGWIPALIAGDWYNVACGSCPANKCSCQPDKARSIELPGPVQTIVDIWIDGKQAEPEDYFLRDGVLYLRRESNLTFPVCNNFGGDPTVKGDGAWSIKYKRGYPVPIGGQVAAAVLTCELAKAMIGKPCQLPQRVQSVTRQGVSMAILDDFSNLDEGRVGIWEIDSWIAAVTAPIPQRPVVWSPDVPLGGQTGTMQGLARGGRFE